ncbi:MAG: hypothetical protein OEO84_06010 [Betaproteobacteria bacterium]|nr:hypothetical protein [Betaproteobacteria bacterium]
MLAALCALLAGCAAPGPGDGKVAKAFHSMPEASVPLAPPSVATTLAEYQREVAGLLQTANRGMVFQGPPPNPLRAVIVMRAEIDVLGEARRLDLVRAPWHDPWLAELVAQTMRQAEPLPRPSMKLLKGASSVTITETWLFDYEGRFRLRSLSLPQAEPPEEDEEEVF